MKPKEIEKRCATIKWLRGLEVDETLADEDKTELRRLELLLEKQEKSIYMLEQTIQDQKELIDVLRNGGKIN